MGIERQRQTKQDVRDHIINNNKNILIAGKFIFMEILIRQEMTGYNKGLLKFL